MPEPEEHQTPERRMAEGKMIATFADLEGGLTKTELAEVAAECKAEGEDPETCVSCRALHILFPDADTPNLDALMQEPSIFEEGVPVPELLEVADRILAEDRPVAEVFAEKVRELESLVSTMLEGPPIPPPNVSLEELAAILVGAEKWVSLVRAQGLELGERQEAMVNEVERVVNKIKRSSK